MKITKAASIGAILSLLSIMPSAYAIKDGQTFKDWKGQCVDTGQEKFCGVTQTIFDADKKPIVNIFVRKIQGQKDPVGFIKVPLGVNLQAGVGLAVDSKEIAHIPYTVCDPAGCNALLLLNKETADKMKKGGKLQVAVMLVRQEVVLQGSLSGFTKAFEAL